MALTKDDIIRLPNTHLRQKSKRVGKIDEKVLELADNMKAATLDWEDSREHEVGVALAGCQVDNLLNVVVIRSNFEDKSDRTFLTYINPRITKRYGKKISDYEGCLSVDSVYGLVPRYEKVTIKALDETGKNLLFEAEGFLARVFQHEIDHTNGKVFIDKIKNKPETFFKLNPKGNLIKLNYEKDIQNNRLLW